MSIEALRKQVSGIDDKILGLFRERMELIEQIAEQKQALGMGVLDPAKEAEKLRIAYSAGGAEYGEYTRKLMEQMMAISRDYQSYRRAMMAESQSKSKQTANNSTKNL